VAEEKNVKVNKEKECFVALCNEVLLNYHNFRNINISGKI
jgi:hypothetical protein